MTPRAKKEKPPPQPDDLVRESSGVYRTSDGRFEVQKAAVGWYIVDMQQANEFGQQLIHGPLRTLDAVRDTIPGTRDIKPLLRVKPAKGIPKKTADKQATPAKAEPPPPPASWIDQLPQREAAGVRSLIRALEKEGLADAEQEVRRHREQLPLMATRLVEQRLSALVGEQPETERERARDLIRRVVEILAAQGATIQRPAPRWVVAAVGEDVDLPKDRIRPDV